MTHQPLAWIWLIGLPSLVLTAQAPVPLPLPALTSSYMQSMMVHAASAANAVACGLRSPQWGAKLHNRLVDTLSTHAGAPADMVDGQFVNTTHTPSEAEKHAALASLASHEAQGQANGTNSVICHITETMELAELDDYETSAQSLWPKIELPR